MNALNREDRRRIARHLRNEAKDTAPRRATILREWADKLEVEPATDWRVRLVLVGDRPERKHCHQTRWAIRPTDNAAASAGGTAPAA